MNNTFTPSHNNQESTSFSSVQSNILVGDEFGSNLLVNSRGIYNNNAIAIDGDHSVDNLNSNDAGIGSGAGATPTSDTLVDCIEVIDSDFRDQILSCSNYSNDYNHIDSKIMHYNKQLNYSVQLVNGEILIQTQLKSLINDLNIFKNKLQTTNHSQSHQPQVHNNNYQPPINKNQDQDQDQNQSLVNQNQSLVNQNQQPINQNQQHINQNQHQNNQLSTEHRKVPKSATAKKSAKYWSNDEDCMLLGLKRRGGFPWKSIGQKLGRSAKSCSNRYYRINDSPLLITYQ